MSEQVTYEETELNPKQCAEVALYMYTEWQKAMQPPIFTYKQFDTWLHEIIDRENEA